MFERIKTILRQRRFDRAIENANITPGQVNYMKELPEIIQRVGEMNKCALEYVEHRDLRRFEVCVAKAYIGLSPAGALAVLKKFSNQE